MNEHLSPLAWPTPYATPNDADFAQEINGVCAVYKGPNAAANARLIAAAPELLALALAVVEEYGPDGGDWQSVERLARAVIAKASGV